MKHLKLFNEAIGIPPRRRKVVTDVKDYISEYKDDIEDILIEFEDAGYKLEMDYGHMISKVAIATADYDLSDKTSCEVTFKCSYYDDLDTNEEPSTLASLDNLKKVQDLYKKNIYNIVTQSIKRLQSHCDLRVFFDFTSYSIFRFYILTKEDKFYNDIPLI